MVDHQTVIRLHEQRMDAQNGRLETLEKRIEKISDKIDKIPWILLMTLINFGLNVILIFVKK